MDYLVKILTSILDARMPDQLLSSFKNPRQVYAHPFWKAKKWAMRICNRIFQRYSSPRGHSHPQHKAIPSEHDRVGALPELSYLILSVVDGKTHHLRSWQLNESLQFVEEHIRSDSPLINPNLFNLHFLLQPDTNHG
jgi:hypothetical protein